MSLAIYASETEFQNAVAELAQSLGWMVAHFRTSRTKSGGYSTAVQYDGKGFPDLVLVHPVRGVLFREMKSEKGSLRPDQRVWIEKLEKAGADVSVWKPSDYDRVERELRGGGTFGTTVPHSGV